MADHKNTGGRYGGTITAAAFLAKYVGDPADGGAGAVYGQYPPLVNVCRKPGEWQSYDIIFESPRWDGAPPPNLPAALPGAVSSGWFAETSIRVRRLPWAVRS